MKYLFFTLVLILSTIFYISCEKDENETEFPTVVTNMASSISATSAQSGGNVILNGGTSIISKGVCWDTLHNPTISNNKTNDGAESGSFISVLNGLLPNKIYFVRAYATNSVGTSYGNEINFKTLSSSLIGWWKFNEGSGLTVYDYSGYNNNGTINGASWNSGGGIKLNGGTTSVDFSDSTFRLLEGTWEVIINITSSDNGWIVSKDNYGFMDDGMITLASNGIISFSLHPSSTTGFTISSISALPTNVDVKITAQWGSNGMSLYVNDVFQSSNTCTSGIISSGRPLKLGMSLGTATSFNGIIKDFKVYSSNIK